MPITKQEAIVGAIVIVSAGLATFVVKATNAAPNVAALAILFVLVGGGVALGMTGRQHPER